MRYDLGTKKGSFVLLVESNRRRCIAMSLAMERASSMSSRFSTWFLGRVNKGEALPEVFRSCGFDRGIMVVGVGSVTAHTEPQPPRPIQWYLDFDIVGVYIV